jgi:hypothetical protein
MAADAAHRSKEHRLNNVGQQEQPIVKDRASWDEYQRNAEI